MRASSAGRRSGVAPNRGALAKSICERARDFELGALLTLLRRKFPDHRLLFSSHMSMSPKGSLVHEVQFQESDIAITLNLGLFSCTSSLPSYMNEWLFGTDPLEGFAEILGLLDDRMLRDRADAAAVYESSRLVSRPDALRQNLLELARPASTASLHWMFSRIFPELGVSVVRAGVQRTLSAAELRLGQAQLGYTAMGGSADLRAPGYDVFLCTAESLTWRGRPWADEARCRLTQIAMPVLAESAPELRILLVDFEDSARLVLVESSTLGFDSLTRAASPRTIILFEGRVEVSAGNDSLNL